MYLQIEHISKTYGENQVLNNVSLAVTPRRNVGLVGANGCGKSTLLKIITGEVEADSGIVRIDASTEVGYLPQTLQQLNDMSIAEMLDSAMGSLNELEQHMRQLEGAMAAGEASDELLTRYGHIQENYEQKGGYDRQHRIETVLIGLNVDSLPRQAPLSQLSGGEQTRVAMSALLLTAPDLLLLDEPTNHLDFDAIDWLEEYLVHFSGAILVVSHDRSFLNRIVQTVVEIDEHSHEARVYSGDYDYYATKKAEERESWEQRYAEQQAEIHELRRTIKGGARQVAHNRPPTDSDKFLKAFKAGRVEDSISRNVRSAAERLRRIEEDPVPRPPRPLKINPELKPEELTNHSPLIASNINKRYGELVLLDNMHLSVHLQTRAAIVGANGTGKSTLLRILAGLEKADSGDVFLSRSARIGYLDQQQETLNTLRSVFEAFRGDRSGEYEEFKAELLGYGLFTYPDLEKRVGDLSIGQQRKVQIAQLCTSGANLFLLDEPTNHVSLDVLEQFEMALDLYAGPILAVSHDRRFLHRFADEVWELEAGRLTVYLGSWDEYVNKKLEERRESEGL